MQSGTLQVDFESTKGHDDNVLFSREGDFSIFRKRMFAPVFSLLRKARKSIEKSYFEESIVGTISRPILHTFLLLVFHRPIPDREIKMGGQLPLFSEKRLKKYRHCLKNFTLAVLQLEWFDPKKEAEQKIGPWMSALMRGPVFSHIGLFSLIVIWNVSAPKFVCRTSLPHFRALQSVLGPKLRVF